MNLIRCEFPSEALHTHVRVTVLLPKRRGEAPGAGDPYPVAYLLHGVMDSGESWLSHTELAELVDDRNIAVVLPNMGNSFCLDEPEGAGYFTFLTEELPGYLEEILPLSPKREETFLGGLSMGGYGSLYAALRKPEKYGRVFSLSGAVDIRKAAGFSRVLGVELPSPLRDRKGLPGGEYDLFSLLRQVEPGAMPPVFLACGTEDYFFRDNRALAEAMGERGLCVDFHALPGDHSWRFWRKVLVSAFDFLVQS